MTANVKANHMTVYGNLILCQVVMTKTLIAYDMVMVWFMSRCLNKDILNHVIFAFQMSLLSERRLKGLFTLKLFFDMF